MKRKKESKNAAHDGQLVRPHLPTKQRRTATDSALAEEGRILEIEGNFFGAINNGH